LQRNINGTIGFSNNKKAAGIAGGLRFAGRIFYSAATFRGGSSAPESWISAT
jgi:hypothetical protein